MSGNEVFAKIDGKKADAHLHGPILDAGDHAVALVPAVAAARRAGLTEDEIILLYGIAGSLAAAKELIKHLELIIARNNPDQPRVPAGSPDGGQFAPSDGGGDSGGGAAGGEPGVSGGKFSKQTVADALAFVKENSVQEIIAAVAKSDAGKEALTFAIGSTIAHGFGAAAAGFWYQEPGLEHDIHTTVHNLAAHAQVTIGRAREMLASTMSGLVAARRAATGKSDDQSDDPVLDLLVAMQAEFHTWHERTPLSLNEANVIPPPPAGN